MNGKRICSWNGNFGVQGTKEQAQNERVYNKREALPLSVPPKEQHRGTFYASHDAMSTKLRGQDLP
jgi:hypothetical protein